MKLKKIMRNRHGRKKYRITYSIISGCVIVFACISHPGQAQKSSGNSRTAQQLKSEQMDTEAAVAYQIAFYQLIQDKDFFKAKSFYSQHRQLLRERDELFSKAFLAAALQQPRLSLECATMLIDDPEDLNDSIQLMLLDLQQYCAASLGKYAIAKTAAKKILEHYMNRLSPGVLKLQHNNYMLWSALVKEPEQTLEVTSDLHLSMYRDSMGMSHVQFKGADNRKFDFHFDFAARISTASESTAEKLHMRFLSGALSVASATGHLVPAKIAICDSLSIDAMKLRNVVFLVLPDEDLTVPQMHYQMMGVLGLPVLQAMHEIKIIHGNEFIVPHQASDKRHGLPLMMNQGQMIVGIDSDPYELHPGSGQSLLFQPYFEANQSMVKLQGRPINMEVGGPGAASIVDGYQYDLSLRIQDKTVNLENTAVLTKALPGCGHLFGRLGQDFIQSFDTVTINLEKMFIDLK